MLQQLGDYARYAPAVLQKQREIGALVQMNDKRCAELFNMFLEEEHCDNNGVEGNPDDGDVTLTAQEHAWMCALGDHHRRHPHVLEHITKRLKATSRDNNSATPPLVELPGELRCPLRISVTVGNVQLTDRLEWDLLAGHHPLAPEFVAERLCAELGLGGEFCTAVAHSIREQVYMYSKCLALVGYAIGGSVFLLLFLLLFL